MHAYNIKVCRQILDLQVEFGVAQGARTGLLCQSWEQSSSEHVARGQSSIAHELQGLLDCMSVLLSGIEMAADSSVLLDILPMLPSHLLLLGCTTSPAFFNYVLL